MYVGVIAQIRYADSLFNSLNVFNNVQYGKAINIKGAEEILLLDVFVPPTADKIRYRPLVVYVHGGGFVNNTKTSDLSTLICTTLAKKGYVTATIDYRLGIENPKSTTQYFEAMYRAQQDVKAAIRYFKKYAEDYGIDKTQIYLVGGSAGAMTALCAVYMNDNEVPSSINTSKWGSLNGTSGNDGFSSNVAGVVNLWGALPNYKWIQQRDAPLLNIGGTDDKTVPYDSAFDYHGFKYGPKALYNYCKSIGVCSTVAKF
jgi:predicted peptidase